MSTITSRLYENLANFDYVIVTRGEPPLYRGAVHRFRVKGASRRFSVDVWTPTGWAHVFVSDMVESESAAESAFRFLTGYSS